jgi:hypothetical protein
MAGMPGMPGMAAATPAAHEANAHAGMPGMPGMAATTSVPPAPTMAGMAGMPGMAAATPAAHEANAHAGMPGMAAATSVPPEPAAAHSADSAAEGHGSVLLGPSDAPGTYQGTLNFDQPGTWTLRVSISSDGQAHETTFDLVVVQDRPRGLVLGGFALVNALALGSAWVLRRRTPRKPARRSARPVPPPVVTTTTEEQP